MERAEMSRFWSPQLSKLSPYVPGEQRTGNDIIKLNTNENPYSPSDSVMQAIAAVNGVQLRRYPEPASQNLRTTLAQYHGLDTTQVFVGNGSDEVLALAFMAFFNKRQPLVFPQLSYSFYPVYCKLYNIPYVQLPMTDDFSIDWQAMPAQYGGIAFPNPNAPTSIACSLDVIEGLLQASPDQVVLVDEAYIDFGATSAISLIDAYPNLLVTQTFSKGRSLAGMRIGAAFGSSELMNGLDRVKNSFNSYPLDVVAEQAAIASIKDESSFRISVEKVIASRDWLTGQLQKRDFTVLPSSANFIFVKPKHIAAKQLHQYLDRNDILVRFWDSPPLQDWLRISIGTDEELQSLVAAIDKEAQRA